MAVRTPRRLHKLPRGCKHSQGAARTPRGLLKLPSGCANSQEGVRASRGQHKLPEGPTIYQGAVWAPKGLHELPGSRVNSQEATRTPRGLYKLPSGSMNSQGAASTPRGPRRLPGAAQPPMGQPFMWVQGWSWWWQKSACVGACTLNSAEFPFTNPCGCNSEFPVKKALCKICHSEFFHYTEVHPRVGAPSPKVHPHGISRNHLIGSGSKQGGSCSIGPPPMGQECTQKAPPIPQIPCMGAPVWVHFVTNVELFWTLCYLGRYFSFFSKFGLKFGGAYYTRVRIMQGQIRYFPRK